MQFYLCAVFSYIRMFLGACCDEITPEKGTETLVHLPLRHLYLAYSEPRLYSQDQVYMVGKLSHICHDIHTFSYSCKKSCSKSVWFHFRLKISYVKSVACYVGRWGQQDGTQLLAMHPRWGTLCEVQDGRQSTETGENNRTLRHLYISLMRR